MSQRWRVSEAGPSSTQPAPQQADCAGAAHPEVHPCRGPRSGPRASLGLGPCGASAQEVSLPPVTLPPLSARVSALPPACPPVPPTHGRYHPPTGRDARPRAHIDIPWALWETVTSLGAGGTGGRRLASNDKSEQEAFWCRLKDGKSPFSTAAMRKALAGQLNSGNENESPRTRGARRAWVCGPGTAAAAASNSTHAAVLVDKLVTAAATMRAKPARAFVIVGAREPTVTNVWKI
ncbi:hypothetical protein T492DRAFT_1054823 [Pavlovales sp. CCMP2436]|nr:hypothetical protein T492DRAFT_1054823 [Pavlovales sp. CCMP2436]